LQESRINRDAPLIIEVGLSDRRSMNFTLHES
jgi:hypothetical protein